MKEQRALCWVSCVKLNSVDLWGGEGAAGDCSAPLRGGARLPSILGWGGHSGIWGWGRWGGWGDPPIDGRESSEGTEPAPDVFQWGFTFRFHCTGSAPRLHPVGPHTAAGSAGIHRLPPKRCVSPQHPLKVGHPITAGGGSAAPPHPQPPGEGGRGGGGRGGAADGDGAVQRCAGGGGGPSAPLRSAPLHPRPRGAEGRMMRER